MVTTMTAAQNETSVSKTQESRVRRLAQRNGYCVRKSRRGGGFMLLDLSTNVPVLGWDYDAMLDEIEVWLGNKPEPASWAEAREQALRTAWIAARRSEYRARVAAFEARVAFEKARAKRS